MSNTLIKKLTRREVGPLTIVAELHADYSPDLSWLGEYTNGPEDDYVFDRMQGWLVASRKIVAETGIARWERHEYRYFLPSENHRPPGDPETWAHVPDEEVIGAIQKNKGAFKKYAIALPANPTRVEMTTALDIVYMCQDYERMEDHARGGWSMTGVVVTILLDGEEIARASLWGIESDCGDDYLNATVGFLVSDAMLTLPQAAEKYESLAAKIRGITANPQMVTNIEALLDAIARHVDIPLDAG